MKIQSAYLILWFILSFGKINCDDNFEVIIIGAGAAGIAAATKLYKNEIKNFLILEAEPHIGGRINSTKIDNFYVDLGAEFVYGQKDNIVYNLVKDLNILNDNKIGTKFLQSNGEIVDETVTKILIEFFEGFKEKRQKSNRTLGSLGEEFLKEYNELLNSDRTNETSKKILLKAINSFESLINLEEGSFSWFDIAYRSDYIDCEGNHYQSWKGSGYKTLLDILMEKYPVSSKALPINDKIKLSKEVKQINWNQDKSIISITCSDGTTFSANHVIFTPSIGILKEQHQTLFQPLLPTQKTEAIKMMGFSSVFKVIMYFNLPWWDKFGIFYVPVWNDEDVLKILVEFNKGPKKNGKSWLSYLTSIYTDPYNEKTLTLWFTGEMVPEIEKESGDVIMEGCLFLLNTFFDKSYNLTSSNYITRSNWSTNPHFRGSHSYVSTDARKTEKQYQTILSEPILNKNKEPIILFAGEATSLHFYSTVHGAVDSGFREADRIISLYKNGENKESDKNKKNIEKIIEEKTTITNVVKLTTKKVQTTTTESNIETTTKEEKTTPTTDDETTTTPSVIFSALKKGHKYNYGKEKIRKIVTDPPEKAKVVETYDENSSEESTKPSVIFSALRKGHKYHYKQL